MTRGEPAVPRDLVQRDGGSHRCVERLGGDRDARAAVAGGDYLVGQAVALGADQQRERGDGGVGGVRLRRRDRGVSTKYVRRVGDERNTLAGQLADVAHVRERDGEDRAHARAHGLRRVGIGAAGPERDARGAEGQRRAQHRADVAGVADAVQVHAQWTDGPAPGAARRRRSRACPSRASETARSRPGSTSWKRGSPRPDSATRKPSTASRPASRGGEHEILALGDEAPAASPLATRGEPLELLQPGILCGFDDDRHGLLVISVWA